MPAHPAVLVKHFSFGCPARLQLPREADPEMKKWPGADLNRRHLHFQCSALPTELPGLTAAPDAGGKPVKWVRLSPSQTVSTQAMPTMLDSLHIGTYYAMT